MNPGVSEVSKNVRELLEDLDLYRLPVSPKVVCEKLGIEYREYPYSGTEGTLVVVGDQQMIGVNAKTREATRKAFTCAHEIGHYYYDLDDHSSTACSGDDVAPSGGNSPKEIRANEFAAELLLPCDLIQPLISDRPPSWNLILDIANQTGASLQATALRYVQLTNHICWLAVLKDGRVHRYRKSASATEHLSTRHQVRVPSKLSDDWNSVDTAVWLGQFNRHQGKAIYESFLSENQYGETLVLIWDRDGLSVRESSPKAFLRRVVIVMVALIVIMAAVKIWAKSWRKSHPDRFQIESKSNRR